MRIFVSYAREDEATATQWVEALRHAGHHVWYDREMLSGTEHMEAIERSLQQADRVVVLWSRSSVTNKAWVLAEAAIAQKQRKLVEFIIDDIGPDDRPMLFRHATADRVKALDDVIDRVLESIVDPRPGDLAAQLLDSKCLTTLVVTAEFGPDEIPSDLFQHVTNVFLDSHRSERLLEAARHLHTSTTLPPQGLLTGPRRDIEAVGQPIRMRIETCFTDWESVRLAVEQVCRADVVVFDMTDFQPGVMLLLGIRAVARKGVTVCSIGGKYEQGFDASLPFNLQMVNVCAHSERAFETGNPIDVIGDKIESGLLELSSMPDYLDLPAYKAVRERRPSALSMTDESREIPFGRGILMLGPFDQTYNLRNWKQTLAVRVPVKVREYLRDKADLAAAAQARRNPERPGEFLPPRLTRLLERSSSRLVTQTFYEAIRNYQLAIVDWTSLRPNVFYEIGVRLASNRRAPIHIIERDLGTTETVVIGDRRERRDHPSAQLAQMGHLRARFDPISYPLTGPEGDCFDRMLGRYLISGDIEREQRSLYEKIASIAGELQDEGARSVVDELTASASSLADKSESSGEKSILFHDVNEALASRITEAAFERRIAAWLYIDRRYSFAEIKGDRSLRRPYSAEEILRAKHLQQSAPDLLAYIKQRLDDFKRY